MTLLRAWRTACGLIAAVLLIGLSAAPALDRLTCAGDQCETAQVVFAQASETMAEPAADPHADGAVCQHGHCHHSGGFVAAAQAPLETPQARRDTHRLILVVGEPARRQFGLNRPPQA